MSGKVNKSASDKPRTAGKKKAVEATQDPTDQTQPAPVAPVVTDDSQASQPAATAPDVATVTEPESGNGGLNVIPEGANFNHVPAGDVVVLEVRAVPKEGFHRAGRFWPHHGVSVFVSDNPDELVLEDDEGKPIHGCVISTADAKRLKAEKMLVVQELETVTKPGAEDA